MFGFILKSLKEQYDETQWEYETIVENFSFDSSDGNYKISFILNDSENPPNEKITVRLITHNQVILKVT